MLATLLPAEMLLLKTLTALAEGPTVSSLPLQGIRCPLLLPEGIHTQVFTHINKNKIKFKKMNKAVYHSLAARFYSLFPFP